MKIKSTFQLQLNLLAKNKKYLIVVEGGSN